MFSDPLPLQLLSQNHFFQFFEMGLTSLPPIWTMSLNIYCCCFLGVPLKRIRHRLVYHRINILLDFHETLKNWFIFGKQAYTSQPSEFLSWVVALDLAKKGSYGLGADIRKEATVQGRYERTFPIGDPRGNQDYCSCIAISLCKL